MLLARAGPTPAACTGRASHSRYGRAPDRRPERDNRAMDQQQERAVAALRAETSLPALLHAATREFLEIVNGEACAISRVVGDVLIQVAEHARDGRTLVL